AAIDTAPAVVTSGLTKRFGHQAAVDSLDLLVPRGAVYGFLGPNGSGKTTTIRMLLGLVGATSGEVEVLGQPMPARSGEVLSRVGALVEGPAFHPYLSGRDNLARLDAADTTTDGRTARPRIEAALERVGLMAAAGKRYRAYSLGMRQRLAIAAALMRPRDLLVLDEPTNGLDPQGTREIRSLVAAVSAEGTTVLISSHLLSEVEQMCSHLGVMHAGHLLRQGTVAEVRGDAAPFAVVDCDQPAIAAEVMRELGLTEVDAGDGSATGRLGDVPSAQVVTACVHRGLAVTGFRVETPSLEDVFVSLTGSGFDVSG
ncbi:MAG: transporter, partial [Marmoricola sp.]|nr:transporter [Marmoricola sp.]